MENVEPMALAPRERTPSSPKPAQLFLLGLLIAVVAASLGCKGPQGTQGAAFVLTEAPRQALPARLEMRWRSELVSYEPWAWKPLEFSQPTLSPARDQLVVGMSTGRVISVDPRNGRKHWSIQTGARVDASPVFHGELILVGNDEGVLYCLSNGGDVRWTYKANAEFDGAVTVAHDLVFLVDGSDVLHVVDLDTGELQWSSERELPDYFTVGGGSEVLVDDDFVYAGFADGFMVALSLESHDEEWSTLLAGDARDFIDVDARPVAWEDRLIVSSHAGGLYALDRSTGEELWHRPLQGAASVRVVGDVLYTTTSSRHVYALDARTGQTIWRFRHVENTPTAAAILGDYILYGGSGVGLFVVDRLAGRPLLQVDTNAGFSAPVTVAGAHAYAMSNKGFLYGFELVVR